MRVVSGQLLALGNLGEKVRLTILTVLGIPIGGASAVIDVVRAGCKVGN